MRKYLFEKGPCALAFRRGEKICRPCVFDDLALIHEKHAIGRLARESHFVRHAHHRPSFAGKGRHHIEYLLDHLG
ncbi:MAG: hypothetical protein ACT6RM_17545, partial [Sphingopyxis sp.]|uniref:hypothetical protein n=1 Tax=Sphingopyxis sp. TaxID=1908224 RepID=UPI004036880A